MLRCCLLFGCNVASTPNDDLYMYFRELSAWAAPKSRSFALGASTLCLQLSVCTFQFRLTFAGGTSCK